MKKIVQKEEEILREIAVEVSVRDIGTSRMNKIIQEMKEALASQEDGVAIAAPQIGYNLRIFVISGRYLPKKSGSEDENESAQKQKDLVFINPVFLKLSREKKEMEEGCLSVRYLYGKVIRAQKATIVAYDEFGNKFTKGASGLIAQIFQHEVDHLNGILFIDKARFVEEVIPDHIQNKYDSKVRKNSSVPVGQNKKTPKNVTKK